MGQSVFCLWCVVPQRHLRAQSSGFTLVCSGYCDADRQLSPVFLEAGCVRVCVSLCVCLCAFASQNQLVCVCILLVADLLGQVPSRPRVGTHSHKQPPAPVLLIRLNQTDRKTHMKPVQPQSSDHPEGLQHLSSHRVCLYSATNAGKPSDRREENNSLKFVTVLSTVC